MAFSARLLRRRQWIAIGYYTVFLVALSVWIEGSLIPKSNLGILWFFSGLISLLLSAFLTEKKYTSFHTAITNSITGIGIMYALWLVPGNIFGGAAVPMAGIFFFTISLLIGILGAFLSQEWQIKTNKIVIRLADGKIIYSLIFFVAILSLTFKTRDYSEEQFLVLTGYFICVFVYDVLGFLLELFNKKYSDTFEVMRWISPAMLVIQSEREIALGEVFSADNKEWKVIQLFRTPEKYQARAISAEISRNAIGILSKGSDTEKCYIDLISDEVREKQVVESPSARGVYFQIMDLELICEETGSGNKFEFMRAHANRVYQLDDAPDFLPAPGTYFELSRHSVADFENGNILWLQGTSVYINKSEIDTKKIVTHNIAVLGSVGSGKTNLAFILEKTLAEGGAKILCFDDTNQHGIFLESVLGSNKILNITEALSKCANTEALRIEMENLWDAHFKPGSASEVQVMLVDHSAINNIAYTDQHRQEVAGQYRTPNFIGAPAIAQYVSQAIYYRMRRYFLDNSGQRNAGPCLLIYEEAGNLVPEYNFDTQYNGQHAKRTANCILQGRKFGLGAMIISQRSAIVSKNILYQCNTVFVKKMNDEKGMDYLSHYMTKDSFEHLVKFLEKKEVLCYGIGLPLNQPAVLQFKKIHEQET